MTKELEALERLHREYNCMNDHSEDHKDFALIEQALKALEVINEKGVEVVMVKTCPRVEGYNEWHSQYKCMQLTQEEYELLKEVLR